MLQAGNRGQAYNITNIIIYPVHFYIAMVKHKYHYSVWKLHIIWINNVTEQAALHYTSQGTSGEDVPCVA